MIVNGGEAVDGVGEGLLVDVSTREKSRSKKRIRMSFWFCERGKRGKIRK